MYCISNDRYPGAIKDYLHCISFLSALLHTITDFAQAIPLEFSGSTFFLSMILGIMVEDGVQALRERVQPGSEAKGSGVAEDAVPLRKRVVGYIWEMIWLGVTSTWYFHPMSSLSQVETTLVPVSLVEKAGMTLMSVILLGSGAGLYFLLGIEMSTR